jgi:hypothetical protein
MQILRLPTVSQLLLATTPGICLPPSHACLALASLPADSQCRLLVSVSVIASGAHRIQNIASVCFFSSNSSTVALPYVATGMFSEPFPSKWATPLIKLFRISEGITQYLSQLPNRDIGLGIGAILTESLYQYFARRTNYETHYCEIIRILPLLPVA